MFCRNKKKRYLCTVINNKKNMNIKLHTPKSLKKGSGMTSLKQFVLSLFATTVSIALTFGTAAIIDYHKKQREKREIVMMVVYDMYNSLVSLEKRDSMIHEAMVSQLKIAQDTVKYSNLRFRMAGLMQRAGYTEITERIFSSSIETINTVGNAVFTENVASFYKMRQEYRASVCDSMFYEAGEGSIVSIKGVLNFDFYYYAILSSTLLHDMRMQFAACKRLMNVTDEHLAAYRKEREALENSLSDKACDMDSIEKKISKLQNQIDAAKKRYHW